MPNTVLGRTLPSILDCGLWESLRKLESSVTHALVTDVGNDLMYGADSAQTMAWVGETIDRLKECSSNVLVTGLPIDVVQGLSLRRFEFFRRLMFPRSTLTFETALAESENLHRQMLAAGDQRAVSSTTPQGKWYGLDPIHIRRRCCRAAWEKYLSLCIPDVSLNQCGPVADWFVWTGTAERRWKRSLLLTSQQPTRTSNGNELWLF
jgi:hypothetical protein